MKYDLKRHLAYVPNISDDDREGLRAYSDLCERAHQDDMTPAEAAEWLVEHCERWPWLWDEVYELRRMGSTWKNAAGHSLGDALTQPIASVAPPEEPDPDLFDGAA